MEDILVNMEYDFAITISQKAIRNCDTNSNTREGEGVAGNVQKIFGFYLIFTLKQIWCLRKCGGEAIKNDQYLHSLL